MVVAVTTPKVLITTLVPKVVQFAEDKLEGVAMRFKARLAEVLNSS